MTEPGRADDRYGVIVHWSRVDGVFVAEAPELPGCIAHGDSKEAAAHNLRQAMALWMEVAHEFGDRVPEPEDDSPTLA